MDEYIKRNELAEMIEKNVNLPMGEGYTGKDHELVDWCKAECIRMAHCLPFVCDVVPKSEVERIEKERAYWEVEAKEARADIDQSTKEVAQAIFAEIEHDAFQSNPHFIEILTATFTELKKKYTEGNDD